MFRLRHIILLLSVVGIAVTCQARKKDYPRADVKVSYNYHHLSQRRDGEVFGRDHSYTLLANPRESKYYNYNNEYLDSLDSTPQGRRLSSQLMTIGLDKWAESGDDSAIPRYKGYLYVFKSLADRVTTVYDAYGLMERGRYTEPFDEIEWTVGDSTKNILGYECIMAETYYHGRHWTAWFTPEIPLSDGPWKLCGLPGLILEATETSGQHSFTATGIENCDTVMYPVYQPNKYDKMGRIEMLKAYAAYRKGADAYSRAMIMNTPDGSKIDMPAATSSRANTTDIDFLETDYH